MRMERRRSSLTPCWPRLEAGDTRLEVEEPIFQLELDYRRRLYCTVLYCTVCTVVYCTVLYCTVLWTTDGGWMPHERSDLVCHQFIRERLPAPASRI